MLERVSSQELSEWIAEYDLEPWGDYRRDIGSAIVARTIAEINRDSKRRSKPFQVADFIPQFGVNADERPEQSPLIMQQIAMGITMAMGGKINNGNNRQTERPDCS